MDCLSLSILTVKLCVKDIIVAKRVANVERIRSLLALQTTSGRHASPSGIRKKENNLWADLQGDGALKLKRRVATGEKRLRTEGFKIVVLACGCVSETLFI